MGIYKYLSATFQERSPAERLIQKERQMQWRREPVVLRIEHPTNLVRARALGYRAKQGFIVARVCVKRGGKQRPAIRHGRRSKHSGQRFVMGRNYQWIAEQRANKPFPNLEVLNSYEVGRDGISAWFEVIMIDPQHPSIKADPRTRWIASGKHTGRVYRGLTSAARKSRGMRGKGKGYEKNRPSVAGRGH